MTDTEMGQTMGRKYVPAVGWGKEATLPSLVYIFPTANPANSYLLDACICICVRAYMHVGIGSVPYFERTHLIKSAD